MAAFVKVMAKGPKRQLEMIIPVSEFDRHLFEFAASCPPDLAWSAQPVSDINLRSESSVGELIPAPEKDAAT